MAPLFVLSTPLLSPVMIVLASLWLLDSLAEVEVGAMTYYSAGAIVLLLLLFLGGLAYVVSDDGDLFAAGSDVGEGRQAAGEAGSDDNHQGGEAET
jgi:hypothetical protein